MKGVLVAVAAGAVGYYAVSWGAYYALSDPTWTATPNVMQSLLSGALIGLVVHGAGRVL